MSHSPPELPDPCHLPSIRLQVTEMMDTIEEVQRSLPSEYTEHEKGAGKDDSIGQARKRAIAVLIVLANLVPVCLPILSSILC